MFELVDGAVRRKCSGGKRVIDIEKILSRNRMDRSDGSDGSERRGRGDVK